MRAVKHDERVLWRETMRGVKPLRPLPEERSAAAPAPPPRETKNRRVADSAAPAGPARSKTKSIGSLDRRTAARLKRGTIPIEARLDLHGMTQTRAHRALTGFRHRAHQDGLTFVLVITGKGRSGGESGVLRRQVPEWLSLPEFRAFVVGFEEAGIGHGGEGALYVRIRRARY